MILQRFPSYLVHLMMSTVGLFHIFLFTSCLYYSDSQTFSFCTDKNDGDPCLLSCHTSDVDKDITISKSPMFSVALGTCVSGDQCYTSDGSLYNVTQSGFTTNLEILSFSKSDNATWRCEYTGNPVHDKFLTWSKLPQSITELAGLTSNVTITDDLTISVEVGCLYSIQVPTTKLQLMCGGTLVTSYEMTSYTSNTVCSDPDLSAYICNYTITSNPPARSCNSGFTGYSLKAVVNLHGTTKTYASNISETYRVSFESKTTTTTTTPTIPTTTTTPQEKCFGTSVPLSNKICIPIIVIGALLLLAFAICVVIYCKKKSKENKYAEGPQRSENPRVAVTLNRKKNKPVSDQVVGGQQSAQELNAMYTERKNLKFPKQDTNGSENSKNEQMTDPHPFNNTEQRSPNNNYQYHWNRI